MPDLSTESFNSHLGGTSGLQAGARVVVGVSGGLDSVVLARLLATAGLDLAVCHVNYGLRGEESDSDEAFVRELAEELDAPCFVRCVSLSEVGNRQAEARQERYSFFEHTAIETGSGFVAVGHHQDDQVETVLLNLMRGAGVNGLAGMSTSRPISYGSAVQLIRPLLGWSRKQLFSLARSNKWSWREDASNADETYTRNALRHRVLPELKATFGEGLSERIIESTEQNRRLIDHIPDWGADLSVEALRRLSGRERQSRYFFTLVRHAPEAIRRAGAIAEIDKLLDAQPGRRIVWQGVTIWRERGSLLFQPTTDAVHDASWPVIDNVSTQTPFGSLVVEHTSRLPRVLDRASREIEHVSDDLLGSSNSLVLRQWQSGDRFQPLGMVGTKLVSDILTEAKVPVKSRASQLVLCRNDEIVWLVGHRLAESAKLNDGAKGCVRLEWLSA